MPLTQTYRKRVGGKLYGKSKNYQKMKTNSGLPEKKSLTLRYNALYQYPLNINPLCSYAFPFERNRNPTKITPTKIFTHPSYIKKDLTLSKKCGLIIVTVTQVSINISSLSQIGKKYARFQAAAGLGKST